MQVVTKFLVSADNAGITAQRELAKQWDSCVPNRALMLSNAAAEVATLTDDVRTSRAAGDGGEDEGEEVEEEEEVETMPQSTTNAVSKIRIRKLLNICFAQKNKTVLTAAAVPQVSEPATGNNKLGAGAVLTRGRSLFLQNKNESSCCGGVRQYSTSG